MKVATLTVNDEDFYFASLDGEHYIGTSRRAKAGEEEEIARLMDGDGRFKPMLICESFLHQQARRHDHEALEILEV